MLLAWRGDVNGRDYDGETPLHLAVKLGDVELAGLSLGDARSWIFEFFMGLLKVDRPSNLRVKSKGMYGKYTSPMDGIGRYVFKQTNRAGGVFCLG